MTPLRLAKDQQHGYDPGSVPEIIRSGGPCGGCTGACSLARERRQPPYWNSRRSLWRSPNRPTGSGQRNTAASIDVEIPSEQHRWAVSLSGR